MGEPRLGGRWSIAVLLGVGVLINFFDRVNLSVAHTALQQRFGISDVVFGYLLSSYSWTYAVLQLPSGSLLDRWGVRRVMLVSIVLWSVASGLAAVAATVVALFAARLLLGIGEAPTFPANAKAIGLWFPEQSRGMPTAIFDAAAKLSIGIGTPILGLILLRYGLRANFATTAVLSLIYAGLFAVVYRDPGRGTPVEAGERSEPRMEQAAGTLSTGGLLRQKKVWGVALGSGAYNYCFYLLLTWLPVYLERGVRMSERTAVLYSGLPWIIAAAVGFLVGGYLVDTLIQRGWNPDRVRRSVLIGGTALGLFVFAPAVTHSPRAVLVCLSLALSGLTMASPVIWSIPALLAPAGGTGRVAGIVNQANQIAGISAPIATGYLLTATHNFRAAFAVAGVVLLLGIASYVVLLGRIERVPMAESLPAR